MNLAHKRTLTAVIVYCLFSIIQPALAQDAGNVLVNTNPQGSLVKLTGDWTLSGVSPVKFDRTLSGQYKVEVIRDGYERYHSTTYFSEAQTSQLDITLVPKTRAKSFLRSLIIPGWGQKYYGNNTKSAMIFMASVAAGVGYYFVKDDYDSKVDDYNASKAAYDEATHWSDLPRLEAAMIDAQNRANDAEDRVNIMVAAAAGIYLFNVLDSFLFFPNFDRYTEYKAITARPEFDSDKVGLKLAVKF